ncbi:hypothetical protein V8E52_010590 [Russula decolorans]
MSQLRSRDHTYVRIEDQVDGHCYPPQPVQDKTSQRLSHSSDTSLPLFSLYLQRAEKLDWRRFELLKGDTDQILVFCGLFSATVASLIVPLNFMFSDPNSDDPNSSDSNSLTQYTYSNTVALNTLWFWSLLTSFFCAMLALSIQRWARPNSMVTSPRYSLPEQARLHALFAAGFKTFKFSSLIEVVHGLVHISLGLFLAGLWLFFNDLDNSAIVVVWNLPTLLSGHIAHSAQGHPGDCSPSKELLPWSR